MNSLCPRNQKLSGQVDLTFPFVDSSYRTMQETYFQSLKVFRERKIERESTKFLHVRNHKVEIKPWINSQRRRRRCRTACLFQSPYVTRLRIELRRIENGFELPVTLRPSTFPLSPFFVLCLVCTLCVDLTNVCSYLLLYRDDEI